MFIDCLGSRLSVVLAGDRETLQLVVADLTTREYIAYSLGAYLPPIPDAAHAVALVDNSARSILWHHS